VTLPDRFWHVLDPNLKGQVFILLDHTNRFYEGSDDKWALVQLAQQKDRSLPVFMSGDGRFRQVGIVANHPVKDQGDTDPKATNSPGERG